MLRTLALATALGLALCGHSRASDACDMPMRVAISTMPGAPHADDTPLRHATDALLPEIARLSGIFIRYDIMPRMRAFPELKAHHVELVPMSTRDPERDRYAHLLVLGRMKAMLMLRHDATAPQSAEEVRAGKLRLVMVRDQSFGARTAALTRELEAQGRLDRVADQRAAADALSAHKAEAIIGLPAFFAPSLAGTGLLDQLDIVDAGIGDPVDEGVYIGNHVPASCVDRLERVVQHLRESGYYHDLVERQIPASQRAGLMP